jgi:virulence-associated protein VapD
MKQAAWARGARGKSNAASSQGAARHLANRPLWRPRVYAICFDLDTETLRAQHHNASRQNAYDDIRRVLERHGFSRQQGIVYFGDESVDPVKCVLAVQDLSRQLPWFRGSVANIRMLRIEENNDLGPAMDVVGPGPSTPS